jgi:arginine-tRNA-protein transferase
MRHTGGAGYHVSDVLIPSDPIAPALDAAAGAPRALDPPINVPLAVLPEHSCPYLPRQTAQSRAFLAGVLSPQVYHRFMNAGFRRSGAVIYQPVCPSCRACIPVRVPVQQFAPSKSQRRCRRRNADLSISVAEPVPSEEKFDLYQRYLRERHHDEEGDVESFLRFLYVSPVRTLEFTYRDAEGKLLAVGICDVSPQSLSSVYFYFNPDEARRGLGTFGVLEEIAYARRLAIPHYYLGFWIGQCRAMRYKLDFAPHELMQPDGSWR